MGAFTVKSTYFSLPRLLSHCPFYALIVRKLENKKKDNREQWEG